MSFTMWQRMNEDITWTTDAILSFIHDLETLPTLWDSRIPQHKLGKRKNETWSHLATKYNCSPDDLKRKWQSLQSAYRREKMKEISSGGTYVSRWFAFSSMSFIGDRYKPRKILNNSEILEAFDPKQDQNTDSNYRLIEDASPVAEEELDQDEIEDREDAESTQPEFKYTLDSSLYAIPKEHNLKKVRLHHHESLADNRTINLRKQTTTLEQEERNECTIFGEYVAKKLSKFSDPLCALVQHEIHNILFQAEMGHLNNYSQNSFPTSNFGSMMNSPHTPSSTSQHTPAYEVNNPQTN